LLCPGPLRSVRAAFTAHGSSKPVRVGRFVVIRPRCDGPRSVHRRSGVQLVLGFSHLTNLVIWLTCSCQPPFESGTRPVSGQLSDDHAGGGRRTDGLRFPVAFRRAGVRFWSILGPL